MFLARAAGGTDRCVRLWFGEGAALSGRRLRGCGRGSYAGSKAAVLRFRRVTRCFCLHAIACNLWQVRQSIFEPQGNPEALLRARKPRNTPLAHNVRPAASVGLRDVADCVLRSSRITITV